MKEAHTHLISCFLSEIERRNGDYSKGTAFRILDVGCGSGSLIADVLTELRRFGKSRSIEIFGFEVLEHGAKRDLYYAEAIENLASQFPEVDWSNRIKVFSTKEVWPFKDEQFDLVLSNQVIEHVSDLGWFFEQQHRVMKSDGFSIHHFPTSESLVDPHSGIPLAHWPKRDGARAALIKLFSRLGWGKFKEYRRKRGHTLELFVDEFLEYLRLYTHFRPCKEIFAIASRVGLQVEARYNGALFRRWANGDTSVYPYASQLYDKCFSWALSRVASVTIVCQKAVE